MLLPVHDGAETLREAIDSLLAGTMAHFRCLVIDDGSMDDSAAIAEHAARNDARVEVVRTPRRGLVAALNEGIARTRAPVVVRADADDVNEPRRLEVLLQLLDARPEITVAGSRVRFFSAEGEGISPGLARYESWLNAALEPEAIERDLFIESPLAHPCVAVRTEALRGVGGYRDGDFPEDYDLWLRGWRAGWRFAKSPETLVRIRDHPARVTRTQARYRSAAFLALKVGHLVAAAGLRGGEVVVWGAGRDGVRVARELKRRGVGVRFFVDVAPTKIGRRVAGAEVRSVAALDAKPGCLVVVAVGVDGAREKIRAHLAARGYRESVTPGLAAGTGSSAAEPLPGPTFGDYIPLG